MHRCGTIVPIEMTCTRGWVGENFTFGEEIYIMDCKMQDTISSVVSFIVSLLPADVDDVDQ